VLIGEAAYVGMNERREIPYGVLLLCLRSGSPDLQDRSVSRPANALAEQESYLWLLDSSFRRMRNRSPYERIALVSNERPKHEGDSDEGQDSAEASGYVGSGHSDLSIRCHPGSC
jgi:hypothetical protein